MRPTAAAIVFALAPFALAPSAPAAPTATDSMQACVPDTQTFLTVKGTIHFVRTKVRPMLWPDGRTDYSISDMIDEYELSGRGIVCGPKPLSVRFEFGDVRYVACADRVPATVSGFLTRDASDGAVYLSVISPSDLVCKAPE